MLLPPAGGHAVESPGGANLVKELIGIVQRSAKVCAPGLVNLIIAVADHFCPSLPAAFTQSRASTLADLCIWRWAGERKVITCRKFTFRLKSLPLLTGEVSSVIELSFFHISLEMGALNFCSGKEMGPG